MNNLYDVVDRSTKQSLITEPTFNRDVARNKKLLLKQEGVDAVIVSSKLQVVSKKVIR